MLATKMVDLNQGSLEPNYLSVQIPVRCHLHQRPTHPSCHRTVFRSIHEAKISLGTGGKKDDPTWAGRKMIHFTEAGSRHQFHPDSRLARLSCCCPFLESLSVTGPIQSLQPRITKTGWCTISRSPAQLTAAQKLQLQWRIAEIRSPPVSAACTSAKIHRVPPQICRWTSERWVFFTERIHGSIGSMVHCGNPSCKCRSDLEAIPRSPSFRLLNHYDGMNMNELLLG